MNAGIRKFVGIVFFIFGFILVISVPPDKEKLLGITLAVFGFVFAIAIFYIGRVRHFFGSLLGLLLLIAACWYGFDSLRYEPNLDVFDRAIRFSKALLSFCLIGLPGLVYMMHTQFGFRKNPFANELGFDKWAVDTTLYAEIDHPIVKTGTAGRIFTQRDMDEFRANFKPPHQRHFTYEEKYFYLHFPRPATCTNEDELSLLFDYHQEIFKRGDIVWGRLVQANHNLFKAGRLNYLAEVVYCPSPLVEVDIEVLKKAADAVFALKHTEPEDPKLKKIAHIVTDESSRPYGLPVPTELSGGYRLVISVTQMTRKHFPNQKLTGSLFPLVVHPAKPFFCLPLPSRYWNDAFVNYWHSDSFR